MLGFGQGSSHLQEPTDPDHEREATDVDDITEQCRQRIADVLAGMTIDEVRKLVQEIELRLSETTNQIVEDPDADVGFLARTTGFQSRS